MDVAPRLPDVPFTIAGDTTEADSLLADLPPNVEVTVFVSRDRLISLYRSARVHLQLGAVESFGCSLAEAMLCGCVHGPGSAS